MKYLILGLIAAVLIGGGFYYLGNYNKQTVNSPSANDSQGVNSLPGNLPSGTKVVPKSAPSASVNVPFVNLGCVQKDDGGVCSADTYQGQAIIHGTFTNGYSGGLGFTVDESDLYLIPGGGSVFLFDNVNEKEIAKKLGFDLDKLRTGCKQVFGIATIRIDWYNLPISYYGSTLSIASAHVAEVINSSITQTKQTKFIGQEC